jgi:two-component system nitrogen regulation sensor histidine kinase NtrY
MTLRSRRLWLIVSGIFVVLMLSAIFTLDSLNALPSHWNDVLILYALTTFIVIALIVFGLILVRTLVRLGMERRANQLGSRFKTKMVLGAMGVSLLPLVFLFFVSYGLMNRTLNRWFPHEVEVANDETQALLREVNLADYERLTALAIRVTEAANSIPHANQDALVQTAGRLAAEQGAEGIWAVDANGTVQAVMEPMASPLMQKPAKLTQGFPTGAELWASKSAYFLAARAPLGTGYLIVAHRLPSDVVQRYTDIDAQTIAYNAQWVEITTFKRQILLILSLITILLIFAATWAALSLSKQVTIPIQALAEATREVAAGNFETRVQLQAQDELGSLVRSFNAMTAQLSDSRRQIDEFTRNLQTALQELDQRRMLIETVLENIPTGVLSLDAEGRIQRMNTAASQIFGDLAREATTIAALAGDSAARDVQHLIRRSLRLGAATKELELRLSGRVLLAAVTVSPLGPRRALAGYVVVVDDLTELLRAQRAAAWQEVAQRIAHEIKNPLTPIQLSAERLLLYLARHQKDTGPTDLSRLVVECATLISREVGTLEGLVNEFSQFARFPVARLAPIEPNSVVREALDIFQGRLDGVLIRTDFASELPLIRADAELLRRVIVNLIDNAAEAMEGSAVKRLELITRFHPEHDSVELTVADSGQGISAEDKDKLFLPHFSTKERGTGLGLAIASRVIAEHHGLIRAEDNEPIGSRFVIELPAFEPSPAALLSDR